MTQDTRIRYVLLTVFRPDLEFVVGITKQRGPDFLRGKLTFPGGKLESDESAVEAASREMQEETGLEVPAKSWRLVEHVEHEDYALTTLTATSDAFHSARTREDEPVWQMAVRRHREYAKLHPEQYSPNFLRLLEASLCELRKRQEPCVLA